MTRGLHPGKLAESPLVLFIVCNRAVLEQVMNQQVTVNGALQKLSEMMENHTHEQKNSYPE
jgi:hypothetical protein